MTSQSTITQQPRQLSVNPECLKRAPRISEVPEPPADDKRFMSGPDQKFKMRLCELQCCLVLLGLSVVLCGRSADAQLGPDLDLRRHRLLQRAKAIGVATQVSPTNFIQCEPQDICAFIYSMFVSWRLPLLEPSYRHVPSLVFVIFHTTFTMGWGLIHKERIMIKCMLWCTESCFGRTIVIIIIIIVFI